MDNNVEKLDSLISFLKDHQQVNHSDSLEPNLTSLIVELRNERLLFLKENLPKLKKHIKNNIKKLRISALSLMEYNFHENSHSNILAYLLDYNTYEGGASVLSRLIKYTSELESEEVEKGILNETYTVRREFTIPKGRIDVIVIDEKEKFIIIIENKLLAGIGSKLVNDTNEDESQNTISSTQLHIYEEWCYTTYPDYIKIFFLLNFSNLDEIDSKFIKLSYSDLFKILKNQKFNDNILDDYILLLDSILNPKIHSLSDLKKLANKLIRNEEPEISLIEYDTLKNI